MLPSGEVEISTVIVLPRFLDPRSNPALKFDEVEDIGVGSSDCRFRWAMIRENRRMSMFGETIFPASSRLLMLSTATGSSASRLFFVTFLTQNDPDTRSIPKGPTSRHCLGNCWRALRISGCREIDQLFFTYEFDEFT